MTTECSLTIVVVLSALRLKCQQTNIRFIVPAGNICLRRTMLMTVVIVKQRVSEEPQWAIKPDQGHTHTHTGPSDCTNSTPYRGMKVCHALCCSQISKQLIINGLDCLIHLTSYVYSDCFKSEFKLGALKKPSLNTLTLASHPAGWCYIREHGAMSRLQLQGFSLNTESCQTQVDAGPGVLRRAIRGRRMSRRPGPAWVSLPVTVCYRVMAHQIRRFRTFLSEWVSEGLSGGIPAESWINVSPWNAGISLIRCRISVDLRSLVWTFSPG